MNLFKFQRRRERAQAQQIQELRSHNESLESSVRNYRDVQAALVKDILTLREVISKYKGNDYQDYDRAVDEISKKYNGTADWGVITTGAIIDLRAAFILGDGVSVTHTTDTEAEAERELKWVTDFFTYNGLDAEMAQEIAKEAEIEGKVALRLSYDAEPVGVWQGMVSVRYLSWLAKRYTIETANNDYLWYKTLSWRPKDGETAVVIPEEEFVYKKFGGRLSVPNEAQPKIMKCLTEIDRLDRALRDLREINHLFATPTPDFEVEDESQVRAIIERIETTNWKIGKAFVHTGKFDLKGPDMTGVETLIAEIELLVKMISGTTGIPIHFLGLLDLLKNRATGDNTRELINAATARERKIWCGAFKEMIEKAMELFNANVYAQKSQSVKLDPSRIRVDIPLITQEHWDRIERVLIPAANSGIISKDFVASQIPGVDPEQEAKLREEAEARSFERAQKELELLKRESDERGRERERPEGASAVGAAG